MRLRLPSPTVCADGLGLGTSVDGLRRHIANIGMLDRHTAMAASAGPDAYGLRVGRPLCAALGGAALSAYTPPFGAHVHRPHSVRHADASGAHELWSDLPSPLALVQACDVFNARMYAVL